MDTKPSTKSPREVVDQAPAESSSGPRGSGDTLVQPTYTCSALHAICKQFGTVLRLRLVYDEDSTSNRCYITFTSSIETHSPYEAKQTFQVTGSKVQAELIPSRNVADGPENYIPNVFEDAATEEVSRTPQVPTPFWYVAYYREGRGNYVLAYRYLQKEIGSIPENHLKKYGKGLLIRAKDLTQAKMVTRIPCPTDGPFDSIRPHRTFNHSKGIIYNYDLYEFPEEAILKMSRANVHKVHKMKGRGNMIILTFHGSFLPDSVQIDPLPLGVKTFVERPLQCYRCYDYGHGKNNCTRSARCGRCSVLGSHLENECKSDLFCFHCKEHHRVRSRDCPKYRMEQDILHWANSQHISIGSARREFIFRHGKGGETQSYAASLGSRSACPPPTTTSTLRSSGPLLPSVPLRNKFSTLQDNVTMTPVSDVPSPTVQRALAKKLKSFKALPTKGV